LHTYIAAKSPRNGVAHEGCSDDVSPIHSRLQTPRSCAPSTSTRKCTTSFDSPSSPSTNVSPCVARTLTRKVCHPLLRMSNALTACLVLGSHTRLFNTVLLKAQVLLHKTFAMELVELQARNHCDQDPTDDLQNATGVKKKGPSSPSTSSPLPSPLLGPSHHGRFQNVHPLFDLGRDHHRTSHIVRRMAP
jgi:hypothetical protein